MWLFIITGLVIVAGVAAWLRAQTSFYRRLFAESHLLQVGQRIGALKLAALSNISPLGEEQKIDPINNPRVLRTEAGLVLMYTIDTIARCGPDQYLHHASVSLAYRRTAHLAGETFLLLWAKLLGVEYQRLGLAVSEHRVHHAEFVLSGAEQMEFARRAVEVPDADWLRASFKEWSGMRDRLKWNRLDINETERPSMKPQRE